MTNILILTPNYEPFNHQATHQMSLTKKKWYGPAKRLTSLREHQLPKLKALQAHAQRPTRPKNLKDLYLFMFNHQKHNSIHSEMRPISNLNSLHSSILPPRSRNQMYSFQKNEVYKINKTTSWNKNKKKKMHPMNPPPTMTHHQHPTPFIDGTTTFDPSQTKNDPHEQVRNK